MFSITTLGKGCFTEPLFQTSVKTCNRSDFDSKKLVQKQPSEVFTKIPVPKTIDSFQVTHLLHCRFIMEQQVTICLCIKTEFYEFDSAVLKSLQRLQFYQKELKETSVKVQAYSPHV